MRRFRNSLFALLIGLAAPLLIWVGAGRALYQSRQKTHPRTCALDADCPPGFACVDGHCVSAKA